MAQKYNPVEDLRALGGPEEASRILSALINAAASTPIGIAKQEESTNKFFREQLLPFRLLDRQSLIVSSLFELQNLGAEERVVKFAINAGLDQERETFISGALEGIAGLEIRTAEELRNLCTYLIFVKGLELTKPLTLGESSQLVLDCCLFTELDQSQFQKLVLSDRGAQLLRKVEESSPTSNLLLSQNIYGENSGLLALTAQYNPKIITRRVASTDRTILDESSAQIDSPLVTQMTINHDPSGAGFCVGATNIYLDQSDINKTDFSNLLYSELIEADTANRILHQIGRDGPLGTYFYTLLQDQLQVVKFLSRCRQLDLCRGSLEQAGLEQLRLEAFRAGYHFCDNHSILAEFTETDHPIICELNLYARLFKDALQNTYSGPGKATIIRAMIELALDETQDKNPANQQQLSGFLDLLFQKYRRLVGEAAKGRGQAVQILSSVE